MPRNRFQPIRGSVTLHPPEQPAFNKELDPLWRFRGLWSIFSSLLPSLLCIFELVCIDKMKTWKQVRTFLPSKPDKYEIRFYAVVGWSSLYVHSLGDNSSGNITPSTPAERYTNLLLTLPTPRYNTLKADDVSIEKASAAAM